MYEEMVAWLRSWSELPAHCECYESCDECDKQDLCATFTNESIITKAGEAADAIEELSRENESLAKSVNEASEILRKRWISVTERLPESVHEYVLCCGAKGGQFVGWVGTGFITGGKVTAFQHGGKGRYITHWMPLPTPPKEEEKT